MGLLTLAVVAAGVHAYGRKAYERLVLFFRALSDSMFVSAYAASLPKCPCSCHIPHPFSNPIPHPFLNPIPHPF